MEKRLSVVAKKLFVVVAKGRNFFFPDKKTAKLFRDMYPGSKVSPGPEHWKRR